MRFVVLDAEVGSEKERWIRIWSEWEKKEPFAHPDYVMAFKEEGQNAKCAILEVENKVQVMMPFILRGIREEEWYSDLSEELYDVTTPYGYGGAYKVNSSEVEEEVFWDNLDKWCFDHNVVTLFARMSLFCEDVARFRGTTIQSSVNIVRDLSIPEEEIWKDYEKKVRKNIRRAKNEQLKTLVDTDGDRLKDFYNIYTCTMERREANKGYRFPLGFFQNLVDKLGDGAILFHVMKENKVVSSELVLSSTDNLYSFLGGTLHEYFSLRPNDLLKHEIALWGSRHSKKRFILGGGYTRDDGIYRYKKAFSPNGLIDFRVGQRVFNEERLEMLIRLREKHEATKNRLWKCSDGFFPPYR